MSALNQASIGELLAVARYWLRDVGHQDAFTITDTEAIDRLIELADDAAAREESITEHIGRLALTERRRVRESASRCQSCAAPRPSSNSWRSIHWRTTSDGCGLCSSCAASAAA